MANIKQFFDREDVKMCGIYIIRNLTTNKIYVGQTTDFNKREKSHWKKVAAKDYKVFSKLYPAMKKYGRENFRFEFIEACEVENLNEREIFWINFYDSFNNGYNATLGGNSRIKYWLGKKRDPKTVQLIAEKLRGTKLPESVKKKISDSHKGIHPLNATLARQRRVVCEETGLEFATVLEASKSIKRHPSSITKTIKLGQKCAGLTWKYLNN